MNSPILLPRTAPEFSSMNTAPLRFAVVGLGHIGKRHAEMIAVRLDANSWRAAMCDREATGVADDLELHADMASMLAAHPELDVVCICTPNGLHAEQALLALEAGHHVIVEKPMALNRRDGERSYKALEVGRQVFCVMQNRYSPPSAWLKEVVESGRLGRIHMVQVNCFWNRDDRYYGKIPRKGTSTSMAEPFSRSSATSSTSCTGCSETFTASKRGLPISPTATTRTSRIRDWSHLTSSKAAWGPFNSLRLSRKPTSRVR